jgi:hypothetical protein
MKIGPKSSATREKETETAFRFPLTPVRVSKSPRKQTTANAGEDVGKRSPHTLLVGT